MLLQMLTDFPKDFPLKYMDNNNEVNKRSLKSYSVDAKRLQYFHTSHHGTLCNYVFFLRVSRCKWLLLAFAILKWSQVHSRCVILIMPQIMWQQKNPYNTRLLTSTFSLNLTMHRKLDKNIRKIFARTNSWGLVELKTIFIFSFLFFLLCMSTFGDSFLVANYFR